MWMPFILAFALYFLAKAAGMTPTTLKIVAIATISTVLAIVFSIIGGAFFPSMAVVLKTREDWMNVLSLKIFGSVLGLIASFVVLRTANWLAKLK